LVTLGHHPLPDVALTPGMISVDMIQFEVTLAHKELHLNFSTYCKTI